MPKPPKVDDFGKKVKEHQRYYVIDPKLDPETGEQLVDERTGKPKTKKTRVPGSTTITGLLDKPYLKGWANDLGLEGINSRSYTDETAQIGSVAHLLIQARVQGLDPFGIEELGDFTPNQVKRATFALEAWDEWLDGRPLEPILIEGQMVSQSHRYGGTVDLYARFCDKYTLLDFKTSKMLGLEHKIQITSYVKLLRENDHPVERAILVKVPRNPNQTVVDHRLSNAELHLAWRHFLNLREQYDLNKEWKNL